MKTQGNVPYTPDNQNIQQHIQKQQQIQKQSQEQTPFAQSMREAMNPQKVNPAGAQAQAAETLRKRIKKAKKDKKHHDDEEEESAEELVEKIEEKLDKLSRAKIKYQKPPEEEEKQ
ncbi:hypothetical protein ACFL56_02520 [Candidatus Margulisiibacteriota bacterium]